MQRRTLAQARLALARHEPRNLALVHGPVKQAAVAAVLRHEQELQVLMIRRAEHPKDPWSGHMAFPGGRVDPTDLGPLSAARRETKEEIDLDLEHDGALLGPLSPVPAVAHGRKLPMVIVPYAFELQGDPTLTPDTREVQETIWVPLSFLADESNRQSLTRKVAGVPLQLPCYHFEGRVIWGLTLRMLDELVKVLTKP